MAEVAIDLARYINKGEQQIEFELDRKNQLSVLTSINIRKKEQLRVAYKAAVAGLSSGNLHQISISSNLAIQKQASQTDETDLV